MKQLPRIVSVSYLDNARASMTKLLNEGSGFFNTLFVIFASLMAAGVAFSAARVTLAEQERDLATLRVLGFGRREASYVLLAEIGALLLAALPLGAAVGAGLSRWLMSQFETDLFTFPLRDRRPSAYAKPAFFICIGRDGRGAGGPPRRGSTGPGRRAEIEGLMNATYEQRRGRVRCLWIIAAVLVAAVIAWGLWPRATEVDIATIDKADVRVDLIDEGRTRMHDVYTVSAPISGRVLRVDVEPGDKVAVGDVIARMTLGTRRFPRFPQRLRRACRRGCLRGLTARSGNRPRAGATRTHPHAGARGPEADRAGRGGRQPAHASMPRWPRAMRPTPTSRVRAAHCSPQNAAAAPPS